MTLLRLQQDGPHWTAFEPRSGLKVTASPDGLHLPRTRVPELVDISVTNHCTVGCAYCYRGSDASGAHATLTDMQFIAGHLARAGVFEVALGGGEITEHPHFTEVLATFARAGLVTNFTTRRLDRVISLWPVIEPLVGALAVSVNSAAELRYHHAALSAAGIHPDRVNLHAVMGTLHEASFWRLLREARALGYRVTLLGYKHTSRGEAFTPIPHDWWVGALTHPDVGALSIDTTLAAAYETQILAAGIPASHFHTREGAYSLFIDAAAMTLALSSYHGQAQPFTDDWQRAYESLTPA